MRYMPSEMKMYNLRRFDHSANDRDLIFFFFSSDSIHPRLIYL